MSCSIKQNIIDTMVDKELMTFNPQRNMYEATTDAFTFTEEANRIQRELEAAYGIKTDPVIYVTETTKKSIKPGPYYRDNIIRGSLIRFRQSDIDRFQKLAEVSPEERVEENNRRVAEAYDKLNSSMVSMLTQMGITVNVTRNITDSEGNVLEGVAVADLANKSITIADGGNEAELTEEVLHFYVNALKDLGNPLYKAIRKRITDMPEYAQTAALYSAIENYSEEDIIDEAITKVIVNRIGEEGIRDRETRWWSRTWKDVQKTFDLGDPYLNAAYALFNEDLAKYKDTVAQTKSTSLLRSLGAPRTRELTVQQLVDTHSKLKLDPQVTEDMIKGRIRRPELFFDADGMIVRYRRETEDGSSEVVSHRVTDAATINTFKNNPIDKVQEIRSRPKSARSREAGTALHDTGQKLMELFASKMDGVNLVDLLDEGTTPRTVSNRSEILKESKLTEPMFQKFEAHVKSLLDDIVKVQKEINGSEDVDLMTEVRLFDPTTDTAGTVDILFLFSDNTAAIYDYKFMSPNTESPLIEIEKGAPKLVALPYNEKKLENFDSQIAFYSKVLRDQYGVADIKRSRIIPAHIDFKWVKGVPSEISTFNIGEEDNEFLRHRAVTEELSKYEDVNKKLDLIYKRIEKLKGKRTVKAISERLSLQEAAQELIMQGNFANVLLTINDTVDTINKNIGINDKTNINYITFNELMHYKDVLSIFEDIEDTTLKMREDVKDSKKQKEIEENIKSMNEISSKTVTMLNEKLKERFAEEARFKTDYSGTETGTFDNLRRMDLIDNRWFKEAKNLINLADRETFLDTEKLRKKWLTLEESINKWGNGDSSLAYDRLIKDTGTHLYLVPMFKSEFREEVSEKITDKENLIKIVAWMKERFQIREGAKEKYDELLKAKIKTLSVNATNKASYNAQLKQFKNNYDVFSNDNAWVSSNYFRFLELKPEYAKEQWSDEYAFLNQEENKALLNYYNEWKAQIREFKDILEIEYNIKLSETMIPFLRAGLVEKIAMGEVSKDFITDWVSRGFVIKEDEDDRSGGTKENTVPLPGIRPLRNTKGEMVSNLVSRDMTRSMYLFGSGVYNYINKSNIESKILYMRSRLAASQEIDISKEGLAARKKSGAFSKKPVSPGTLDLFDKFVDIFIYGSTYTGKDFEIFGINGKKLVNTLNNTMSIQTISFPIRIALAARVAGLIGTIIEAIGGEHYTFENLKQAGQLYLKDKDTYIAIADYFDLHAEEHTEHKERRLKSKRLNRWLDGSFLFEPIGIFDRQTDRNISIAMLYNSGFDSNGEFKRLSQLPEGTPNAIDTLKSKVLKDEEGRAAIAPGALPVQTEVNVQQKTKRINARVKGDQGTDNMNVARTTIIGTLVGKFKWFAPGILRAHWNNPNFDIYLDSTTEGRINGFLKSIKVPKDERDQRIGFLKLSLSFVQGMKNALAQLTMLDDYTVSHKRRQKLIAKGKFLPKDEAKYQQRRQLIQQELDHAKNMTEDSGFKNIDLESYIEMRQSSVKQAIAELQIIGTLLLIYSLLSMEGDDDKKLYSRNFATRKFMDILSRVLLETSFSINPMEFEKFNKSLIPAMSLVTTLGRILSNGIKETAELAGLRPEDRRDKSPLFHYTARAIPGGNQFARVFEISETDVYKN